MSVELKGKGKKRKNPGVKKDEKKRRNPGLTKDEELELQRLEKFLFGKGKSVLESEADPVPTPNDSEVREREKIKPAWEDPDDLNYNVQEVLAAQGRPKMGVPAKPSDDYQKVLKKRFETRVGNPQWARLDRKIDDDDDELLKRCGNFLEKKREDLSAGTVDFERLKPLNKKMGREGPYINSVQFHPTSTVAMVAGSAGVVTIFQVDGSKNPHLQSVRFDNFPIRCARFSQNGNQFIVGSQRHSHFFVYDMMEGRSMRVVAHHATEKTNMKKFEVSPDGKFIAVCGKFGHIHLLDARTREWVGALKMNGEVTTICFNPAGSQLWSHGDGGEVYVWDVASRVCLHRFVDEGCLQGTSLAISPSNQLVACGSSSGVVNVYKTQQALQSRSPQPVKALLQLVTAATALRFNPTSQILAMASDAKDNALKLVHFPSVTVFSNFPGHEGMAGRPVSLDFSPGSGYMAVGSNQHTVPLFRLKHFGNY